MRGSHLRLLNLGLFLVAWTSALAAQDLSVPLSWRLPNSTRDRNERIHIAQDGLETVRPFFKPANGSVGTFHGNLSFANSAQMMWTLAFKDEIADTKDNLYTLEGIRHVGQQTSSFGQDSEGDNQSPVYWAMAMVHAYRAYRDYRMLELAQNIWSKVADYQIKYNQVTNDTSPSKNITFSGICDGGSVGGALWASTAKNNVSISAVTTANFVLLSAHLHQLTNGSIPRYLLAAEDGAEFLKSSMLDKASGVLMDTLVLGTGAAQCTLSTPASAKSYTTGSFIEALAVLTDVSGDAQWAEIMVNTLVAGTKSNSLWVNERGIIIEGEKPGTSDNDQSHKGKFVRSLYEPWARSNRTDVRNLISAFVNVQAHAVLDFSTTNHSNNYSSNWHGPPATSFTWAGALANLNVLTAAIAPDELVSSASGSAAPAKNTASHSLVLGLAIALPLLALLVLGLLTRVLLRRRRQRAMQWRSHPYFEDGRVRTGAGTSADTSAKRRALYSAPFRSTAAPPNLDVPAAEADRAQGAYAILPALELVQILNQRLLTIGARLDNGAPPVYEETMGN